MTVSGVPNIRVILREADTENLLVDVPNLTVKIVQDSSYNVNTVQPVTVTLFSGSYNRFADVALLAYTASYISGSSISASYAQTASYALNAAGGSGFPFSGSAVITGSLLVSQSGIVVSGSLQVDGPISATSITSSLYGTASVAAGIDVIYAGTFITGSESVIIPTPSGGLTYTTSASYALTSSYADFAPLNIVTATQNSPFQILFISESKLAKDIGTHIVFNPVSHVLQISGGLGIFGGTAQLSPRGLVISSGSDVGSTALNHYGIFTRHSGNVIGVAARPVSSSPYIANTHNPSIFVTSGSELGSVYIPIEFQGSGSYTDGQVTVNTPLIAKQGITVTGSLAVRGIQEEIILSSSVGATTSSFDFSNASIFYLTGMTGNGVWNITNVPTTTQKATTLTFVIEQGSTAYSASAYQLNSSNVTVKWLGSTTPTGSANKTDIIGLTAFRSGSTWNVVGVLSSFG